MSRSLTGCRRLVNSILSFSATVGLVTGCSDRPLETTRPLSAEHAALTTAPNPEVADSDPTVLHDTNYVVMAGGVYHKSCVHEVPDGGHTRADTVFLPNNAAIQTIPQCNFPHFAFRGYTSSHRTIPPQNSGWIVDVRGSNPSGSWRSVSSQWTVPAAAANGYSYPQAFFVFNGIQTAGPNGVILQPVLSWGQNGHNRWQISAVECTNSCTVTNSDLADVAVGDVIYGSVVASNCSAGNCEFTVYIQDLTTGVSRSHTWTQPDNAPLATAGVMESNQLNNCGDFPDGPIKFTNVTMADQSGNVTPVLHKEVGPNNSPSCGADALPAAATTSTSGAIRIKNFAAYLLGETNVYTGYSCTYAATMYGGWAPPLLLTHLDGAWRDNHRWTRNKCYQCHVSKRRVVFSSLLRQRFPRNLRWSRLGRFLSNARFPRFRL